MSNPGVNGQSRMHEFLFVMHSEYNFLKQYYEIELFMKKILWN